MLWLIWIACIFSGYVIGITIAAPFGGKHKDFLQGVEIWPRK